MKIREHLLKTRDGLCTIKTLTQNLGSEPSIEQIEQVIQLRDSIILRIKDSEQQLTVQNAGWANTVSHDPTLHILFSEAKKLLQTVAEYDIVLAHLMESRMADVKQQLSYMYHASKAASSYSMQNSFGATR